MKRLIGEWGELVLWELSLAVVVIVLCFVSYKSGEMVGHERGVNSILMTDSYTPLIPGSGVFEAQGEAE